jgi:pimeloyl-ACP methyl ester carboxylesterase
MRRGRSVVLYVRESGPPTTPTVVYLHGGGASGWTWLPVVERLQEYHALVPDLPEQGRSKAPPSLTIVGAAVEVADLIRRRAHGGRANLVGLSLGAQIGVALLATAPSLVDRALLSGALVRPVRGLGLLLPLLGPTAQLYWPLRNLGPLVAANRISNGIPAAYAREFAEDTRLLTAGGFVRLMRENLAYRLPEDVRRASVPTLVTVGEREYGVMRESARELVGALPSAEGRLVASQRHNWPLESPDLFAAALRAWLSGAPLPPELRPL